MKRTGSKISSVLARVAVYAIFGAWICAFIGIALISASFALITWLFDHLPYSAMPPIIDEVATGAWLGGCSGAIMGFLVLGVVALVSYDSKSLLPSRLVLSKVVHGMSAATAIFVVSFVMVVKLMSRGEHAFFIRLIDAILDGSYFLTFGLPAFMMCGQVLGAMWGFRLEKEKQRPLDLWF